MSDHRKRPTFCPAGWLELTAALPHAYRGSLCCAAAREALFNKTLAEVANSTHAIELKGTTAGPSTIGFDNEEEVALLALFDTDKDGRMSASELHTLKWLLSRIHEGHEVCCHRCMHPTVVRRPG